MTANNELEVMWNKEVVAHHEKVFRHLSGMTKHLDQYLNQTPRIWSSTKHSPTNFAILPKTTSKTLVPLLPETVRLTL